MHRRVREHWPDAPIASSGSRWARLRPPDGCVVYIQTYTWDEETRPQYIVAWHSGDDEPVQERYPEFGEAIAQARARCEGTLVTA